MSTVYTPTGESYHASVQLPSDGDQAVVASVNAAAFQYVSDNYAYLRLLLARHYSVENYGAVEGGVTDCTTAFQNAIDAANTAGGGTILVPPGNYRLNSGLTLYRSTSLLGQPGTVITQGHTTGDLITLGAGTYKGTAALIGNITFEGAATSSGRVIYDPSGATVRNLAIVNCAHNVSASNLTGRFLEVLGPSDVTVQNCRLNPVTSDAIRQGHASSHLRLVGNTLRIPASTYNAWLLATVNGTGIAVGNTFDTLSYAAGTGACIRVTSTDAPWLLADNTFRATSPAIGMVWSSAARIVETGSLFDANLIAYDPANGELLRGSRLTLREETAINMGPAGSWDLPPGYRAVNVRSTATSGPALKMPTAFYPGQELKFTYYNASGSTVVPSFTSTPVTGTTVPNVGPGNTLTGTFIYEDRDVSGSSYRWIQVGTWGVGLTLV